MKTTFSLLALTLVLLGGAVSPQRAEAQLGKRLKERAKDRVEEKIGQKQDKAIDEAMDGKAEEEPAEASENTSHAGHHGSDAGSDEAGHEGSGAAALKPGQGVWANYDFVPGERPLFVSDLTADRVGNFPRRLEFAEGNMEVVDWQGQRLLRATSSSAFYVPLPETLPERFTIEFDAFNPAFDWIALYTARIEDGPMHYGNHPGSYFLVTGNEAGIEGKGPEAKTRTEALREGLVPVRILVDGSYAKMYLGEHRVANVPNANIVRGNQLHFIIYQPTPETPTYLGNLRVMADSRVLYEVLAAEGRVATQGILFDPGSDRLRPESTPTLQEIGQMLQQHADLRLGIEGHTDAAGDDAANQQLSERRAAAVKAYLVATFGLDPDRLEAQGLGETRPVASNDTPEGRQQNRRVELVRR